jgi:uncharacterized membrane protein YdjX (TVP38/TMEM64 family)
MGACRNPADMGDRRRVMRFRQWSGSLVLAIFAVLGVIVVLSVHHPDQLLNQLVADRAQAHAFVARMGLAAPLLYVLAYAALMLLLWLPAWPCTVVGGFLFGPWFAIPCALAGSTLGGTSAFLLARAGFGGRLPSRNPFVQRLAAGFQRDALSYVFALRVIPIMPFGIIHLAAAACNVPFWKFVLGTAAGMVPSIVIFAVLGSDLDSVANSGARLDVGILLRPNVAIPLSALALLAIVPATVKRFSRLNGRHHAHGDEDAQRDRHG